MLQASAPGKVLVLGGYLIVQSPNVGISVGVSARFTTRVVAAEPSTTRDEVAIHIASPQFKQHYTFTCNLSADEVVHVKQTAGPESTFLYYSVLYAVAAACMRGDDISQTIHLELLADNDFYSQRNYLEEHHMPVTVENLRELPKRLPLVGAVSKTGLGSSAAMTTSLVACLCSHFHGASADDLELIHRVAQVAHSVSQGKIGSGFDVFTAVYGTCAYRRFPARAVEAIMTGSEKPSSVSVLLLQQIVDLSSEWVKFEPFRLPHGFHLVLGDVHCGGSSTPGMVAKIMAWQKSVAGTKESLWERLRSNNEAYIEQLIGVLSAAKRRPTEFQAAIDTLKTTALQSHNPATEEEKIVQEASKAAADSRRYLREMGQAADVKVEPEELTELLNQTAALPGVFAAGCPGAGGYDAVFAIVLGDEQTCRTVEHFWESYKALNVCPLLVREDPSGLIVEKQ